MELDELLKLLSKHKRVLNRFLENPESIDNKDLDRLIVEIRRSLENIDLENDSKKIDVIQKDINEIVQLVEKLKKITLSDISNMERKTTAGIRYLKNSL
ncbi:hypothetical protein [Persephonella hydrogeniphila]|uniref:hypothetical protein n=1 Tax=Persephonella hydrogeniphila TaxID=198703 RepID=UPI000BE3C94C|nr:hypothetical protein [Persephonella hydrogeniphila]